MTFLVASIPGVNVHSMGDGNYAVSTKKKGYMGAAIVSREGLFQLAEERGGKIREVNPWKVLAKTLGVTLLTAAAIFFRKDISKLFKLKPVQTVINKIKVIIAPMIAKLETLKLFQYLAKLGAKAKSKFMPIIKRVVTFIDAKGNKIISETTTIIDKARVSFKA